MKIQYNAMRSGSFNPIHKFSFSLSKFSVGRAPGHRSIYFHVLFPNRRLPKIINLCYNSFGSSFRGFQGIFKLTKTNALITIPQEGIENKILLIRGQKVMLDRDLAQLYGVTTSHLKRQVRRNRKRFPADFMFELSDKEFKDWRCQFGTSNSDQMGLRHKPFVFTEHGILMLSSVLNSERAIQINIQIMRAFVKLREVLSLHKELQRKIEGHDQQIKYILKLIQQLLTPSKTPKMKIGFLR